MQRQMQQQSATQRSWSMWMRGCPSSRCWLRSAAVTHPFGRPAGASTNLSSLAVSGSRRAARVGTTVAGQLEACANVRVSRGQLCA